MCAVEIQYLIEEYRGKTDEELLRLALDPEQLTPAANVVLHDELARRRINSAEGLSAFRKDEEQRKEEQGKNIGSLFVFHSCGIGRKRFGKAGRIYSPETEMERFKTTIFIVLFWLPLIPTGTFLIERKRAFLPNQMKVLEKLPLDWEQVLTVWVITSAILLVVILMLRLLPRFLFLYRA